MRKLLLLLLILGSFAVTSGQELPVSKETGKVEYTAVIQQAGSKAELFNRGKIWIASTFKSAKDVIQAQDEDKGYYIIKGLTYVTINNSFRNNDTSIEVPLHFTITINFNENSYQYSLSNLYFAPISGKTIPIEDYLIGSNGYEEYVKKEYEATGLRTDGQAFQEGVKMAEVLIPQYKKKSNAAMLGVIALLKEGLSTPATNID